MFRIKVLIIDKNSLFFGKVLFVKPGFARNYLIPYGKAVNASSNNLIKFNKSNLNINNSNFGFNLDKFNYLYKKIISLSPLNLKLRCDYKNKLFGSIKNIDIKNIFLDKLNIKISKKCIILPNGPIKYLGNYIIKISLYKNNIFDFLINVIKLNS